MISQIFLFKINEKRQLSIINKLKEEQRKIKIELSKTIQKKKQPFSSKINN